MWRPPRWAPFSYWGRSIIVAVRAYPRVSTDEQFQEGFSIAAQREAIQKFCDSQGWTITEWYVEEGESAKDLTRTALTRLRADLRPGETVVVYKLDRLTRSVLDLYTLLHEWDGLNVGFRSVTEVYDTTTALGRLFITLVAALAQWERENLAERVRFGMVQMVMEGKWYGGPLPYGYVYDQTTRRLVPHPDQAPVVRQIFEWYAAGRGAQAIANDLNARGLRTNQANQWWDYSVRFILGNQVYLGHTVWNKKGKGDNIVVHDTHEPIVTTDLFNQVREIRERNAGLHPRRVFSSFALTGVARCALCGSPINGKTQAHYRNGVRHWESRRLLCTGRKHDGSRCTLPTMKEDRVIQNLLTAVAGLADPNVLRTLAAETITPDQRTEERQILQLELTKIERKIRRWWDDYDAGDIPARVAKERTAELETRAEEIRRRLAVIPLPTKRPSVEEVAEVLRNFSLLWTSATVDEQKALVTDLFCEILIFPNGAVQPKLKPLSL